MPNGLELSCRGSIPHQLLRQLDHTTSLDFRAASPVSFSELFGGTSPAHVAPKRNSFNYASCSFANMASIGELSPTPIPGQQAPSLQGLTVIPQHLYLGFDLTSARVFPRPRTPYAILA